MECLKAELCFVRRIGGESEHVKVVGVCFAHVQHMTTSLYAIFEAGNGLKTGRGCQSMTWQKSMESLTDELAGVGAVRWSPRDPPN